MRHLRSVPFYRSHLSPQRDLTAEEKRAGITSLNPPTVKVRARLKRADTNRALIDACCRAVGAAGWATTGETGGPAGVLMTYLRTSLAVRGALRLLAAQLGEDIWDSTKGWP